MAHPEITSSAGDPALRRIALVVRRSLPGIIAFALIVGAIAAIRTDSESGFVSEGVIELTDDVSRGITTPGSKRRDALVAIEAQRRTLESTRVLEALRARTGNTDGTVIGVSTSQPQDTPVIVIRVEATTAEFAEMATDTLIELYIDERTATAVGGFEAELVPLREQRFEQQELVDSIVAALEGTRVTGTRDEISVLENKTASALKRLNDFDVAISEREFFQSTVDGDVSVVESSAPATQHSESSTSRAIQFGLVAMLLALGVVIVVSRVRGRLHLLDEVRAVIGPEIPVVATVPRFRRKFADGDAALVVNDPRSQREAESFRYMRSALEVAAEGLSPLTILFTSASANEGKTVTAANLALASAQSGRSTFLLDGDLLNSSIASIYSRNDLTSAFRSLLDGELDAGDDVWLQVGEGEVALAVLISAIAFTPSGRSELSIDAVTRVFRDLKKKRDIVVIDGPPVLAVSDAMILARSADVTFVVVRMSRTTRRDLDNAMNQLKLGGVHVAGVIVSHSRERRESYYSYGYDYGQGSA